MSDHPLIDKFIDFTAPHVQGSSLEEQMVQDKEFMSWFTASELYIGNIQVAFTAWKEKEGKKC